MFPKGFFILVTPFKHSLQMYLESSNGTVFIQTLPHIIFHSFPKKNINPPQNRAWNSFAYLFPLPDNSRSFHTVLSFSVISAGLEGMMGEGAPHSPENPDDPNVCVGETKSGSQPKSEVMGAGNGCEEEERLASFEVENSIRRRPPLKRQITRNQSDPKILPVWSWALLKCTTSKIDHGSSLPNADKNFYMFFWSKFTSSTSHAKSGFIFLKYFDLRRLILRVRRPRLRKIW